MYKTSKGPAIVKVFKGNKTGKRRKKTSSGIYAALLEAVKAR